MEKLIFDRKISKYARIIFCIKDKLIHPPKRNQYLLIPEHKQKIIDTKHSGSIIKADGLIINKSGIFYMQTADCIPVVVNSPESNKIGLFHISYQNLSLKMIKKIFLFFSDIKQLQILYGPSICGECYDHETFVRKIKWYYLNTKFPAYSFINTQKKRCFDLKKASVDLFNQAGVKKNQIKILPICTNEDLNLSYHHQTHNNKRVTTKLEIIK